MSSIALREAKHNHFSPNKISPDLNQMRFVKAVFDYKSNAHSPERMTGSRVPSSLIPSMSICG
ncbi:MAG TPA: hypothetical protein VK206_05635, partial [Anaerolineales bacterium]|nr:hypothetical protein [Anaerolineales bacterium]